MNHVNTNILHTVSQQDQIRYLQQQNNRLKLLRVVDSFRNQNRWDLMANIISGAGGGGIEGFISGGAGFISGAGGGGIEGFISGGSSIIPHSTTLGGGGTGFISGGSSIIPHSMTLGGGGTGFISGGAGGNVPPNGSGNITPTGGGGTGFISGGAGGFVSQNRSGNITQAGIPVNASSITTTNRGSTPVPGGTGTVAGPGVTPMPGGNILANDEGTASVFTFTADTAPVYNGHEETASVYAAANHGTIYSNCHSVTHNEGTASVYAAANNNSMKPPSIDDQFILGELSQLQCKYIFIFFYYLLTGAWD